MLSVRELSEILVPAKQVSAAYSLDPLIAEAQVVDDRLRIWGRSPGKAVIVLVDADFSTSSVQITVTQAPPILPETEWGGLGLHDNNSRGYGEVRAASGPLQVGDTFDYRGQRVQLHFNNVDAPAENVPGTSSVWFPYSYLRLTGDDWKLTLVDQDVESSPLSVNSTLLRGVHLGVGGLTVHAGYTSVAGFQSLFLPAHKQLISGATFTEPLNGGYQVGATGYFIQRDPLSIDPEASQAVGTLFLNKHTQPGSDFKTEVGLSNGVGGAVSYARSTQADQFHITARYRPRHYAASETDNLNGLQSEAGWDHPWGAHLVSAFSGFENHLFTRTGAQTIEVATENLRYKAFDGISVSSGVSVSRFSDNQALFPDIRRYSVPIMMGYDRARFGIGAQYEYSQTSKAFSSGQAYRGLLRWSGRHFQMNANAGLDTQALGVDSVFSSFPALNVELAKLGLGTSTSIDQLAALLADRAFLSSLGITPGATLQLVPRNWHAGMDLSWRSARQTVELDSNYNLNSFLTQQNTTVLHTLRYRRGFTNSTEFVASFSLLDSMAPVPRWTPTWQIAWRHQFGDGPFSQLHEHRGSISGTVRLQDSTATTLVHGVEITLDGDRKTVSDGQGYYRFSNVRPGMHTVEISFKSSRTFWYTTSSKVSAQPDSIVDFGIMYPAGQVAGYVLNDAGAGLPDIGVEVKGPQGETNLTTDQAGKFFVPVAQPGVYTIQVKTETVANGYALDDLDPASVSVGEGEFKKILFTLPAIRGLTGMVQEYDAAKEEYIPVRGASIEIAELARHTATDSNGRYSFRNVPSGTFTILVNGQYYGQVLLSAAPQLLRHDIRLSPNALAAARR
jgi:hypothetical protein